MSEERKFSKESFIYVIGEAFSRFPSFILLPIYTRYLNTADFAILTTVTTLWPVIVIVLGQGFAGYIIRGYFDYEDKRAFFGSILLFSLGFALVAGLVIHAFGATLFGLVYKQIAYQPYLKYAVFYALFRLYFIHVVSFYRAKRAAKTSVSLSMTLFFVNLIAVLISVYYYRTDLQGILFAQLLGYIVVALIFTIKIYPEISFKFHPEAVKTGIWFVLPLFPHAISAWIVNNVSRVFVENNMGLADLAIFNVAMQLGAIMLVTNNGLNQAWGPFVYANYKEEARPLFNVSAQRVVLLVILIGSTLILFSRELLMILGKTVYLSATWLLPVLAIAYVLQMLYFIRVTVLIYHKKTRYLPLISIGAGGMTILANFLLVPTYGMLGAAASVLTGHAVMAILASLFARKFMTIKVFSARLLVFAFVMALVLAGILFFVDGFAFIQRVMIKFTLLPVAIYLLVRFKLLNFNNLRQIITRD